MTREALQPCEGLRGKAARECASANAPNRLLRQAFNALDCAHPSPAFVERCAARERVIAGCGKLPEREAAQCRADFMSYVLEPRDCDRETSQRSACLRHNIALNACRGLEGQALDKCFVPAAGDEPAKAMNCGGFEGIELEYCRAANAALAKCRDRQGDDDAMRACVKSNIPAGLSLAAVASFLRRMGVPH